MSSLPARSAVDLFIFANDYLYQARLYMQSARIAFEQGNVKLATRQVWRAKRQRAMAAAYLRSIKA